MSQDVIALTLVALASVYLVYRMFGSLLPQRAGCSSGCGRCPANALHNTPLPSQAIISPSELTIL